MRLIDADVADKWMQQNNAFIDSAILKAIPTIDAVPVVRKPVPGYEGYYEVDNLGRVFSVDRIIQVNDNGRIYDKPIHGAMLKQTILLIIWSGVQFIIIILMERKLKSKQKKSGGYRTKMTTKKKYQTL